MPTEEIYSVSELSGYIRYQLEQDEALRNIQVQGEISNFTAHQSGHWYFTLKDSDSQISCAFFKGARNGGNYYKPMPGDQVKVRGSISVYVPRGTYQLMISGISPAGEGDLYQQFLKLKNQLASEGLFDTRYKKSLPLIPNKIGVVTSLTGAVIQDICNTLKRRWPGVEVIVSPARMQGEGCAESVMNAFDVLNQKIKPDVIIIARGGGSPEDLWGFNDERLVRKVFNNTIPVISAIGHETDFTLLDFVADVRAPTPTAAAELSVPDRNDYISRLNQWDQVISREISHFTLFRRQWLDDLSRQIQYGVDAKIQESRNSLRLLENTIEHLDIRGILARGFSIITKDKKRVTQADELKAGDRVTLHLYEGQAEANIETTKP